MATSVNANLAYPMVGSDLTSDKWSSTIPHFGKSDGVVGGIGSELALEAPGGMKVRLRTGAAWVDSRYGSWTTDNVDLDVAGAPGAGLVRIDRVVLQLNYSSNTFAIVVKSGTPAASGAVVPAPLTNTGALGSGVKEVSIGQVRVTNGDLSVSIGMVTDERSFATRKTVGEVFLWTGAPATWPVGAVALDGTSLSRITYWQLALVEDPSGSSATFPVKDKRGEALTGLDNMGTAAGAAGRVASLTSVTQHLGAATVTLTIPNLPPHDHGASGTTGLGGAHDHVLITLVLPVVNAIKAQGAGMYNGEQATYIRPAGDYGVTSPIGGVALYTSSNYGTTDTEPNHSHTYAVASQGSGTAVSLLQPTGGVYVLQWARPR